MKILKIISFFTLIFLSSNAIAGGGWTKKKGKTYVKVAGWWVESKDFFSGNGGESTSSVDNGLFNLNVYAEYGFTDKLTAIAYVPFFTRSYQNKEVDQNGVENSGLPGGSLNSLGDAEIGLKYSIFQNGRFALAGSVILGLPFGNDGSDQKLALATGDGEFNQLFKADLGVSLYNSDNISLYGNVYMGYNNRTEDFSDEFRGGLELGLGLAKNKFWLVGKYDIIESFENGDKINEGSASVFANNSEVKNLTAESAYYLSNKIGINVSASFPLSGQNVYNAPAYSAGIFYDLK